MIKLNQHQYIELNKKYDEHYKKYDYQSYELAKDAYLLGITSRQAEIDELQIDVEGLQNDLIKAAEGQMKLFEHNNELQKRIDEALSVLSQMKHNGAYVVSYILKGEIK